MHLSAGSQELYIQVLRICDKNEPTNRE